MIAFRERYLSFDRRQLHEKTLPRNKKQKQREARQSREAILLLFRYLFVVSRMQRLFSITLAFLADSVVSVRSSIEEVIFITRSFFSLVLVQIGTQIKYLPCVSQY